MSLAALTYEDLVNQAHNMKAPPGNIEVFSFSNAHVGAQRALTRGLRQLMRLYEAAYKLKNNGYLFEQAVSCPRTMLQRCSGFPLPS